MSKWKTCTLAEIGEIVGGATPSTKDKSNYENGTISWITPKDLSTHSGRYISRGERMITENGMNSCSTRLLPKNSILFSSRAPIGYIAIAQNEMCTNQGFKSIIPNSDMDYLFIYYLLLFNKDNIENMGSGTTFKEVSGNTMKSINVSIPESIDEQRKIASILSSIDDKIELNNKINENLELQAQAIFKSWFVDFEPFGGVMPEDWEKKSLSEISEMSAGGDKPKNATEIPTTKNTVPIYSNGISNEGLYGFTDKAKIVEESVTVSARGTIGYVCLRQTPYVPIVRLITIIPRTNIVSAKYIYLHLKTMKISGTGTTQQQLTVPNFKSTELSIPNITVINKFTSIVNPMFEKIKDNKIENQRLASLRDTLLPKLMNGEIDVSEVKI